MTIQNILWLCISLSLLACLPKTHHAPIKSPYVQQALALTQSGQQAMQHQQWPQAHLLFNRAKIAAELADHTPLISASWYNIGMAYVGEKKKKNALQAFQYAKRYANNTSLMRIKLAQALLNPETSTTLLQQVQNHAPRWPTDIYLSAARLAQQQHHPSMADLFYQKVLSETNRHESWLHYQAQAWFGLALLHEQKKPSLSHQYAEQALQRLHQLAHPQLNAHVLWLLSRLTKSQTQKHHFIQRACTIYTHLKDLQGISRCQKFQQEHSSNNASPHT